MTQHLIALYVISLPFEYIGVELFDSVTELKPYRLIAAALVAVWLFTRLAGKRWIRLDGYDWVLIYLLFSSVAMAAFWQLVGDEDLVWVANDVVLNGFALVTYLVMKNCDTSPGRWERLVDFYVYAVCASIVLHVAMGLPTPGQRCPAR